MIAALFVQESGCYANLPEVDHWPEKRDARLYSGPHPVIAHPPCQLWSTLSVVNYKMHGGEHNKPGNDKGCFASALKAVQTYGGVLEHPANSFAFRAHGISKPPKSPGWYRAAGGWVCEVWQSAYGHRANKATWLYFCGGYKPFPLCWERIVGKYQIGSPGKGSKKPQLSKRENNATPIAFRDELIRLAAWAVNPLNDAMF